MVRIIYGIDVSQDKLDVRSACGYKATFDNNSKGRKALSKSIQGCASLVVMEATNNYHKASARHLYECGVPVSVVNPCRASHFGKAIGALNKNDKADALTLAKFGASAQLPLYEPPAPEREKLRQLARQRTRLLDDRTRCLNQMKDPELDPFVKGQRKAAAEFLMSQNDALSNEIKIHLRENPVLREEVDLVQSIFGFGWISAVAYVAEIGDVSRLQSAKQAAAFAGICPAEFQSGTSKNFSRLSKRGQSGLRRCLYHPGLAAIRVKGIFQDIYLRLLAKGACKMTALCAVMHKLCRTAFAVLKTRTRFDAVKAGLTTA